jgi:hypothetical protein
MSKSGLQLKLRAYGIDVRPARNAALMALAGDLPVPVLADVLGLHTSTAVHYGGFTRAVAGKAVRTRVARAADDGGRRLAPRHYGKVGHASSMTGRVGDPRAQSSHYHGPVSNLVLPNGYEGAGHRYMSRPRSR